MSFFQRLGLALSTPERRKHVREYGPQLTLTIDGRKIRTLDWSLGGFHLPGKGLRVARGDKLEGKIRCSRGAAGDFTARIMRITEGGEIAGRWLEISADVFGRMGGLDKF